jgi:hypothetical protein
MPLNEKNKSVPVLGSNDDGIMIEDESVRKLFIEYEKAFDALISVRAQNFLQIHLFLLALVESLLRERSSS